MGTLSPLPCMRSGVKKGLRWLCSHLGFPGLLQLGIPLGQAVHHTKLCDSTAHCSSSPAVMDVLLPPPGRGVLLGAAVHTHDASWVLSAGWCAAQPRAPVPRGQRCQNKMWCFHVQVSGVQRGLVASLGKKMAGFYLFQQHLPLVFSRDLSMQVTKFTVESFNWRLLIHILYFSTVLLSGEHRARGVACLTC